ncbi:uncharacterized protein N7477_004707 [Penicillium maclennaniae]|uniref:uncharacterized protein n=1 Tax=Penicillium maclennaniae TaxID=1343394 RepID=UPI0025415A12|nr:uncharacterized protein N7477_004707 [Penicillium maclennaniae]KAJ5674773.1 hypothetical protein N7477_004707 [Penicillium maclennaniae]
MMEKETRRTWGRALSFLFGPRSHGVSYPTLGASEVELVTVEPSKPAFAFSLDAWQRQFRPPPAGQAESAVSQVPRWIRGVYYCARVGACVILVNVVSISVAAGLSSRYGAESELAGSKIVYRGSCTAVKNWDVALHLIINALSTSILGASNYCMQSLVAPTREEVDACHAKGEWLDIGTASLGNLFKISRRRVMLWIILLITATPFHILYNSMIFESIATNEFVVYVGPHDLAADNVMNLTTPALEECFQMSATYFDVGRYTWYEFSSEIAAGNFTHLSLDTCRDILDNKNAAGIKALMFLAEELSVKDGGNLAIQYSSSSGRPDVDDETFWMTNSTSSAETKLLGNTFHYNTTQNVTCALADDTADDTLNTYTAHDCIQISAEEKCQLLYSPTICIVISLCALAKVIAMFFAARISHSRSMPLLTIGDAVASFVTRPDPTTEGMCWISKSDVSRGLWGTCGNLKGLSTPIGTLEQNETCEMMTYKKLVQRKWYLQVPSKTRWASTLFLCLSGISVAGYLLGLAIQTDGFTSLSTDLLSEWWREGVGSSNYNTLDITLGSMVGSVMVANIPQLLLTMSYYCLNNIITDMLAAAEYNSYGVTRKPLRVTRPVKGSQQKSTYWLSIPYQYGVPLLLLHMILHWLISQSLYYVLVVPYNVQGEADYGSEVSSLGYSPLPIFLAILVSSLLVFLLILLSCKRLKSVMPLAGACSAAISAACHPPKGENLGNAVLGPIRWGQTIEPPNWVIDHADDMIDGDRGHCSFTALDAVNPTLTKLYA